MADGCDSQRRASEAVVRLYAGLLPLRNETEKVSGTAEATPDSSGVEQCEFQNTEVVLDHYGSAVACLSSNLKEMQDVFQHLFSQNLHTLDPLDVDTPIGIVTSIVGRLSSTLQDIQQSRANYPNLEPVKTAVLRLYDSALSQFSVFVEQLGHAIRQYEDGTIDKLGLNFNLDITEDVKRVIEAAEQVSQSLEKPTRLTGHNPAPVSVRPSGSPIAEMDPFQFEKLIVDLLRAMELDVSETRKTGDGGIDAIASSSLPIIGGVFIVQCKRYSPLNFVGVATVRDLYGVITDQRASKGILITTSDFSAPAWEFAQGKPIELINGEQLQVLLERYQLSVGGPVTSPSNVLPLHLGRLIEGLLSLSERTHRQLALDKKIQPYARKDYTRQEFVKKFYRWDEVRIAASNNTANVLNLQSGEIVTDRWIQDRLDIASEAVAALRRVRQEIVSASPPDDLIRLRDLVLKLCDAMVISICENYKRWADWLPPTYQDEDNFTFQIDTEEVNRVTEEVICEGVQTNLWVRTTKDE